MIGISEYCPNILFRKNPIQDIVFKKINIFKQKNYYCGNELYFIYVFKLQNCITNYFFQKN